MKSRFHPLRIAMLVVLAICFLAGGLFARPADRETIKRNAQLKTEAPELNRVPIKDSDIPRSGGSNELDEIVWEEDFEAVGAEWVVSDAGDLYWQTSDHSPLNGDNWRCYDPDIGTNGGYNNHWLQWLVSPIFDLSDSRNPVLSFDFRVMIEPPSDHLQFDGWDTANVWVSDDGGMTWTVLTPTTGPAYTFTASYAFGEEWAMVDDIPGWGGVGYNAWAAVTMNLADYAGDDLVRIAFCFCSDPFACTEAGGSDTWTGFQVDNIEVSEGETIFFADDADGNNEGGDFMMYDGRYPAFSIFEVEDAPSGDYVAGIYDIPLEFSRYATYTEDIDLSEYEDGATYLDVMVSGEWDHPGNDAYWTMHVKPSDDDVWYYACDPYGETGDEDVYDDLPDDWEWFSVEWEEYWDLTPYHGETIQVRIEFTSTSGDTSLDWHIYFDDLSVIHNSPPEAFNLLSPEDGEEVNTASPTLEWEEPTDPDEDSLSYVIYYALEEDFADADSVTDIDTTEYTFDEEALLSLIERHRNRLMDELDEFDDDTTVYWKVRADDGFSGTWSSPDVGWSFDVFIFDPPEDFWLVSPSDGVEIDTLNLTFAWRSTTDPDEGDEITYTWCLSTSEDLTDSITVDAGGDTTLDYTGLDDDTQYYWAVHAIDTNTDGTWSGTRGFRTYWPEPPTDFALLEPADGGQLTLEEPFEVLFSWGESVDPDPRDDEVLYTLFLYAQAENIDDTLDFEGIENTQLTVNLSEEFPDWDGWNLDAEWWVVAVSNEDETECEVYFTFMLNLNGVNVESFTGIPTEYSIASVYPNPFNPVVTVVVGLPHASELRVTAFNLLGREVAVLTEGRYSGGYHHFAFEASQLSSGIYFIHATVPGKMNEIRKVVLMR